MHILRLTAVCAAAFVLNGCQTVTEKQPSIAHTHVGHSLTAWKRTPGQIGLYQVAEEEAFALRTAVNSATTASSLAQMKLAMADAAEIIEPPGPGQGKGKGFGLKRALSEATSHLEYAARSDDASANFRASIPRLSEISSHIQDRIDLVQLLATDVKGERSAADAGPLLREVQDTTNAIINGTELDGVAPIGSRTDEYGLRQMRNEIAAMTARETPAYVPVAEKWLFGLIRLENGDWKFDFSSDGGGGGGGGSY